MHHGHLIVARSLVEQLSLERIVLVPAASPPHKSPAHARADDRLEMLRLATEGEGIFEICEDELQRSGPSYTLDTLCRLRQRHGPGAALHWVIGADMLPELPQWHRVTELLEIARLIVCLRPPWDRKLPEILEGLRQKLPAKAVDDLEQSVVRTPLIDISSTDIRSRVGEGKSIRYLLPERVRRCIAEKGIYAG